MIANSFELGANGAICGTGGLELESSALNASQLPDFKKEAGVVRRVVCGELGGNPADRESEEGSHRTRRRIRKERGIQQVRRRCRCEARATIREAARSDDTAPAPGSGSARGYGPGSASCRDPDLVSIWERDGSR